MQSRSGRECQTHLGADSGDFRELQIWGEHECEATQDSGFVDAEKPGNRAPCHRHTQIRSGIEPIEISKNRASRIPGEYEIR